MILEPYTLALLGHRPWPDSARDGELCTGEYQAPDCNHPPSLGLWLMPGKGLSGPRSL